MIVKLPSGLAGEVRKLKGTEADVLADRKAARKGETFDKVLAGCWLKTEDPGPYRVADGGSVPWGKVLVCDRFLALMVIRIATYGPLYTFKAHCDERERGCGARFDWEVNLETQLPIFDLPEDSRAAIREGRNRFNAEAEGRRVVFKLQTGEDEWRAGKKLVENKSQLMTTALANRIVEVDGIDKRRIDAWVQDLDMDVQLDLMAQFEAVDGGVETNLEIECPECDRPFEVSPPFEGADFWLPRQQSRKKSRDGRESRTLTAGSPETSEKETETT